MNTNNHDDRQSWQRQAVHRIAGMLRRLEADGCPLEMINQALTSATADFRGARLTATGTARQAQEGAR